MVPISATQAGELLAGWLAKNSTDATILKQVVAETGYNDSPWFGAAKARVRLTGEMAISNSALVIFAVNQVFTGDTAKAIIDAYLVAGKKSVFSVIEAKDGEFADRYQRRMREYFDALHGEGPGMAMSFAFMTALGVDPIAHGKGQVLVAARLGHALSSMVTVLRTFSLTATDADAIAQVRALASPRSTPRTGQRAKRPLLNG